MKTRTIAVFVLAGRCWLAPYCCRARTDFTIRDQFKGEKPVIAVADMHGSGAAEQYMDAFNKTLWDELAVQRTD